MIHNFYNYDITISTAFFANHGISGHLFEEIELYHVLTKAGFRCKLLLVEIGEEALFKALKKYKFNYIPDYACIKRPERNKDFKLFARQMLFVDGDISYDNNELDIHCDKIIVIGCESHGSLNDAETVLQDTRIYSDRWNSAHYVKKILFSELKKPEPCNKKKAMLYCTSNCRKISDQMLNEIISTYDFDEYMMLVSKIPNNQHPKIQYVTVPASFNELWDFDTYIYTPLDKNGWCKNDCSPRFICECAYFNRKVIYHGVCDYPGLRVRKYDIETHLDKLELTENDPIVKYFTKVVK